MAINLEKYGISLPPARVPSPLTFSSDDVLPTANVTQVVLIERGFPQFQSYVNDKSFAIVYEPDSSISELKALLRQKFTSTIHRIAVVSHYSAEPNFLETETLFVPSDLVPGASSFSKNTQGLIDILKEFHVAHLDFLACKTLSDPNWTAFYRVLQSQSAVIVGASLDDTGNLKYGGNWTMENTQENVKQVYFNNSIDNYASLLATVGITYSFGTLNYSYTVGGTTASIISTGTLTGAVTLPEIVDISGVNYNVTSFAAFSSTLCVNVTSIVILSKVTSTPVSAFAYLGKLVSVTFPNTVTTIGAWCFNECLLLSSFNWPPLLTAIPERFFSMSVQTKYNDAYVNPIVIPNGITSIGTYAFTMLGKVPSFYIPPNCTIGSHAFFLCIGATDVTYFGSGALPYFAFAVDVSLKTLTFGPGITSMTAYSLDWCAAITSLTLPSTLLSFDLAVLGYCTNLQFLTIPASVTTLSSTRAWIATSPANLEITFAHETSFPTVWLTGRFPMNCKIKVSKKVQLLGNYTYMLVNKIPSDVTVTVVSTVNFSAYTPTIPTSSGPTVDLSGISTANLTDTAVIGTTVTEQKQFTASTIKTLFTANTAQKQLILPAGSVLPGFSTSLTDPVSLFNASSTVANNKKAVLTKSDILSKKFYVLLEAGDSITLQSNTDSVVVSKAGSTFTLTSSAGTTTRVAGGTYTYDGLSLTLGSIYGTLTPTSVNFVLSALNNVITLGTSGVIPSYNLSLTSDATITLTNGITVAQAQNTFYFRTDDPITLDASFVYYYVDTNQWANKAVVLSPKNGIVTSNAYVASDAVGKDFLRDLAKQLFGTHLGADLFTNEDSVISDINSKCDTVANNLISLLGSIDKTSGSLSGLQIDSSGNKYFKDDSTTSNISRELFNQLMTNAVSRFSDIKGNYKKNAVEDGIYRMPILAGDSITFKMTISPSSGQITAVPTGPTTLLDRTYTVILNVV